MPEISAQHNQPEYTVSEISGALKRVVEDTFGHVRVRGEISGFKQAASGHAYLMLKDENACMDAVAWKGTVAKLPFRAEDGLEVICTGRLTTYPGRSKYQLIIEQMEPAGVGALMALLEQRKKQLEAEGLFKQERKKPIPFLPEVIGVVTSPTGAVIRDILHRISDRFPRHVLVWPVLVQGQGSAEQIAAAIEGFNAITPGGEIPRPDLLIVARGGGSLEDLWSFNEEIVVRAAAASKIPLISAVGHETDTTLIDYASDRRAPTPTAAAEMAVPVRQDWLFTIMDHGRNMAESAMRLTQRLQQSVEGLARGLPRPSQLLEHAQQRLDDRTERLQTALPGLLQTRTQRLVEMTASLNPRLLQKDVETHTREIDALFERMQRGFLRTVEMREQRLSTQVSMLSSLDYRRVLERGYALVKDKQGKPVTSAAVAKTQPMLTLLFKDGEQTVSTSDSKQKQMTLFEA